VAKVRDETRASQLQLEQQREMLEIRKSEKEQLEKETQVGYKQRDKRAKTMKQAETAVEKESEKSEQVERHIKELRHELKVERVKLKKAEKEYGPLFEKRAELDAGLGTLKTELFLVNKEYEDLCAEVDENKKRIEAKMRERDLLNKDVVLAEESERDRGDAIQTLEGELKKLQNKI
jgi:chromosome segregation ATPase